MRVSAACLRRLVSKGPGAKRGVGEEPAVVSLAVKKKKNDDGEAKAGAAACRTDIQENQLVSFVAAVGVSVS